MVVAECHLLGGDAKEMSQVDLKRWQTEVLRHSTLLREPLNLSDLSLWEPLVGKPPIERSIKPREQFVKEEGPYLDGWLTVEARPKRIDWRLGHNPQSRPSFLPIIGPYNELHEEFLQFIRKWQGPDQPVHRLAFGAVLLLPCDSLSEAYLALDRLLPSVVIDPDNTRDFLYQINRRRRSSALEGRGEINRLSTWSVVEVAGIEIDVSSVGISAKSDALDKKVCRLEIDVNSAPEFEGPIDPDQAELLTMELFGLASELVAEGDVG